MKKAVAFMLAASVLLICLSGCSAKPALEDLSQVTRIEIRAHSDADQTYTDHVISGKEAVKDLCDTFSSLKLKKVNITKPLEGRYEVRFFKSPDKKAVESFTVVSSDVISTGSDLYKITSGEDLLKYLSEAVANAADN